MTAIPPVSTPAPAATAGVQTAPFVQPASRVYGPSPTAPIGATSLVQQVRNVAHAAGTIVGFLMVVAYGITAILKSVQVDVSGADWRIGAVGAGIVGLSQAIDSWNNVNQTTNAVNAATGGH